MKLFKKAQPKSTYFDLSKKQQQEVLLKAAKKANKEQKTLESRYLKLQKLK